MTHSPSLPTSTLARMSTNSFLRHRVKAKSATTRNHQTNLLWRVANFREKNNPFMSRIPHKHPDGQIKCHNEFSLCCCECAHVKGLYNNLWNNLQCRAMASYPCIGESSCSVHNQSNDKNIRVPGINFDPTLCAFLQASLPHEHAAL